MRRVRLLLVLAIGLLAASASPAWALTVGQHASSEQGGTCADDDFDALAPTVTSGNSYVIPGEGRITSWTTYANGDPPGQEMSMKVFRHVSDTTYMAVAHDGPRVLTPGGTAGNTFATNIAVLPGDIVGVNSGNAGTTFNACMIGVSGQPYLFRTPGLADGMSGSFNSFTGFRPNVSAVFEPAPPSPASPSPAPIISPLAAPSNAFELAGIKRNKKKGIAFLIGVFPGPGIVGLEGPGVNKLALAASAGARKNLAVTGGRVKLKVAPAKKGKKARRVRQALKDKGKAKVKVTVTYIPTGGTANTQVRKVKLLKKR